MCASFDTKNTFPMDNFSNYCLPSFGKLKIYHLTVLLLPEKFFFFFVHMQQNFSFIFRFTIIIARKKNINSAIIRFSKHK